MKINKFLYGVLAFCGCVVSMYLFRELFAFLSPDDLGTTLMAVGGAAATAGETMRGTVTTTKTPKADGTVEDQDINRPTISKKITKINPSLFPMDTLLRELENVPCSSFEYQYYSVRGRGVQSKVKTAYTVTAGSESGAKQINVINAHIFSQDGNVLFPTMNVDDTTKVATPVASGGFSLNPLICHIVATDSIAQDKITIYPINAAVLPALPADTPIYRLGVAKHENAGMSEDPSQMPYSDSNYCQIHMTTVSEGLYQRLSEKEVNFGILDMREQALLDFRMTNEADALFGVKERFVDPVTRKVKYMSDGLVRKIEKHLDMGAESKISNDLLYGWCSDVFCGNNGSERRIMFYGKDFGRQMAGASTVQKQLEAGSTEVVFGITFHRISTPDGELLMKPHDLLNEYGYSKAAIVIDPANVYRAIQKPLEATELDRDKTGLSRSSDVRIDESHTLAVTNPDAHALLTVK